jgi:23S rRNA (cytidine2498-2'-O)-methyltransferase
MQPPLTLCLTADPDFLDLALAELRAAAPAAAILAEPEPGLLLIAGADFFELAGAWRAQPPIFVRHICPVMAVYELSGSDDDLERLQDQIVADFGPLLDPDQSFSIQTRIQPGLPYKPFDINKPISAALAQATDAPLDVRHPTQILSILIARLPNPPISNSQFSIFALAGLSLPAHNLSDWAGGKRRFAREPGRVSRAEFKLLEALETFGIDLPPRGVALDLGASPGGWTRVLRQREQYVTAIDPGKLDPRVAADPKVRHLRMLAETYLADEPDQFDVIVNDMRMDARDSARLMTAYADQLYPGGVAIMTLKLPEHNRDPILHHAFEILRQRYVIAGARHLFHNRSEITVYLKKL